MSEQSDDLEVTEVSKFEPSTVETKPKENEVHSTINYFRVLLLDSMLTGIPQILIVNNLLRKLFKSIILIACIIGFIYQTVEFMKLYHTYPSTVEIVIKHLNNPPLPCITICNINAIQIKKFCKDYPDSCVSPINLQKFCKLYPTYCAKNTVTTDTKFLKTDVSLNFRNIILGYGQEIEKLIHSCCIGKNTVDKDNCTEISEKLVHLNEYDMQRKCYNIDFSKLAERTSDLNGESESSEVCESWVPASDEKSVSLLLNLQQEEYSRPDLNPSAQIGIHSSNSLLDNPFIKGFTVEAGKRYIVRLTGYEEELLPAPYSSNCTPDLPKDYSREKCLFNCYARLSTEKCGCIFFSITVSNGTKQCFDYESIMCSLRIFDEDLCEEQCPKACYYFYFKYDVIETNRRREEIPINLGSDSVTDNEMKPSSNRLKFDINNGTVINVIYSTHEITRYIYKPKYDKIEILGFIGGYSGIWLGVSLVAVFDFFETVTVFMYFVCNKSKKTPRPKSTK